MSGRPSPVPRTARLQWYDVERLAGDLDALAAERLRLVQLVSEPVALERFVTRVRDGAVPVSAR